MKDCILVTIFFSLLFLKFSCAQETENSVSTFPFEVSLWNVVNQDGSDAELVTKIFKGKQSILLGPNQIAHLRNETYRDFSVEFYCNGMSGPGIGFRVKDKKNFEYLYLRLGANKKRDALQYVPIHNGNLPWQLYNYPKYEGYADFPRELIGHIDIDLKDSLLQGKINSDLLSGLKKQGLTFSSEAELYAIDSLTWYVFDPSPLNVILFEIHKDSILLKDAQTWIHMKVDVIENRALFYIEDMKTPAFVVNDLKGSTREGGLMLTSDALGVHYSDIIIKEIKKHRDFERNRKRSMDISEYLTSWQASKMFVKDSARVLMQVDSLNNTNTAKRIIESDKDGLVDLSRYFDDMTKTVALSCDIHSDYNQEVNLNFDYADHLMILLNSESLFDQGMNFSPPEHKGQQGRVFVDDESVKLNLTKGKNRLIFVLTADNRQKFNWGFIAKLDSMAGLRIETP